MERLKQYVITTGKDAMEQTISVRNGGFSDTPYVIRVKTFSSDAQVELGASDVRRLVRQLNALLPDPPKDRGRLVPMWIDNKVANRVERPVHELVTGYWASKWSDVDLYPWPLERRVRAYISANRDDDGMGVTMENEHVEALCDVIAALT